ncbi:hypothetical protein L484_017909 [Morus notabilis]|uniref:Uncharacterized protein n=1 Tax=Morus notabilis TaxID=981085 RepID=W9RXY1_9ROSA|nr:hypothetical protein L484_017909 [Morus notabilis]
MVDGSIIPLDGKRRGLPVENRSLMSRKLLCLGCPLDVESSCGITCVENAA